MVQRKRWCGLALAMAGVAAPWALGQPTTPATPPTAPPPAAPPPAAPPTSTPPASSAPAGAATLYKAGKGEFKVVTRDQTWRDEERQRDVPVRVYLPEPSVPSPAPQDEERSPRRPLVVFSHGLWASRAIYGYFAEHLASHGYIVIVPSHAGSDTASLFEGAGAGPGGAGESGKRLMAAISDPDNLRNRPKDVSLVITEALKRDDLRGRVDRRAIGAAGHSFGAYTVMAVGGMTVDIGEAKGVSMRDGRVKAILPMSPEGEGVMGITAGSWEGLAVPVLFLTGSRDYGAGERSAAWRRAGFEGVKGVDDYLVTLNGAGHLSFADLGSAGEGNQEGGVGKMLRDRIRERLAERAGPGLAEKAATPAEQKRHTEMIQSLGLAFFDAYVRDDAAARKWLAEFAAAKHDDCTTEFKAASGLTIVVDAGEAPDLQAWGEKARAVCLEWWPKLMAELPSEGYSPRTRVTIAFRKQLNVPAATGGGTISVSADWVRRHPEDLGMMVHELVHVVQAYPNRPKAAPGWLVEGVADYVRFYKYEPGADRSRIDPARASYRDSYRTTARFLDYLVRTHDPQIVKKVNAAMRAGGCDEADFKQMLGTDIDVLWKEFIESLGK